VKLESGKLKVAVLAGGVGTEREISIQSGNCVAAALKQTPISVIQADITPDNLAILDDCSIDVFFLALHGRFGEDGRLQQILEDKQLCYTGSGPEASRLAFDKMASKKAFLSAGVAVPPAVTFSANADWPLPDEQLKKMGDMFVVKPVTQGSSFGISIINDMKKVPAIAAECLTEFGDCMVEKFVPGSFFTVGILLDQALPIIEVQTERSFYDFDAKYADKHTKYLFDTISDVAMAANIKAAALDCFSALGCRHFARVDFILADDGIAYALELNSIPGLTSHSLLPKAAQDAGLSMSELCVKIVEAAVAEQK